MDDLEGCGKVIAIVGLISSLIGIFVFVTGIVSIPDWLSRRSRATPTVAVVSTSVSQAPVSRKFDCVGLDESPVQRGLVEFLVQKGVESALLAEPEIDISNPDGLALELDIVRRSAKQDYYDVFSGQVRLLERRSSKPLDWRDAGSVHAAARQYDVGAVIFTEITGKAEKGILFNTFESHWVTRASSASTGEVVWIGHCNLEDSK
jgi:hypothetical protein